jgi:hypothetical protein
MYQLGLKAFIPLIRIPYRPRPFLSSQAWLIEPPKIRHVECGFSERNLEM